MSIKFIISVLIGKLESGISTSAGTYFSYDVAHMVRPLYILFTCERGEPQLMKTFCNSINSSLAYPNSLGTKGYVVVVVV